jgi:hypothetical protein
VPSVAQQPALRKVTPNIYSSPSLPPPPPSAPKPSALAHPQRLPGKVLRAGMALQDAVSSPTEERRESSQAQSEHTTSSQQHDFLDGFSSGTKRELRAGLRFGEELAKRQKPTPLSSVVHANSTPPQRPKPISHDKENVLNIEPQTDYHIHRAQDNIRDSPFAMKSDTQTKQPISNAANDESRLDSSLLSTDSKPVRSSKIYGSTVKTPAPGLTESDIANLGTTARLQYAWWLENQAVIREIENATPSKVIVLDGDSDEENTKQSTNAIRSSLSRQGPPRENVKEVEGQLQNDQEATGRSSAGGRDPGTEVEQAGKKHIEIRSELAELRSKESPVGGSEGEMGDTMMSDDEDIWLQTAQDNSSSPHDNGLFTRTEQRRQQERAAEVVAKPRRSLIPSPWKRGENMDTSGMSNAETSGLFWQKQSSEDSTKFGAGEIARQKSRASGKHKRQVSGEFDLNKMLSSPVKHAVAGRANKLTMDLPQPLKIKQYVPGEDDSLEDKESSQAESSFSEEGQISQHRSSSVSSSPPLPQKIPVKFNDSTLSIASEIKDTIPPDQVEVEPMHKLRHVLTPPRSAMKGTRLSFSPDKSSISEHPELRRVVFNERSMYLNSDGDESSMSAKLDSPLVEKSFSQAVVVDEDLVDAAVTRKEKKGGWLNWTWRGKCDEDSSAVEGSSELLRQRQLASRPAVDGTNEADDEIDGQEEKIKAEDSLVDEPWQPTRSGLP